MQIKRRDGENVQFDPVKRLESDWDSCTGVIELLRKIRPKRKGSNGLLRRLIERKIGGPMKFDKVFWKKKNLGRMVIADSKRIYLLQNNIEAAAKLLGADIKDVEETVQVLTDAFHDVVELYQILERDIDELELPSPPESMATRHAKKDKKDKKDKKKPGQLICCIGNCANIKHWSEIMQDAREEGDWKYVKHGSKVHESHYHCEGCLRSIEEDPKRNRDSTEPCVFCGKAGKYDLPAHNKKEWHEHRTTEQHETELVLRQQKERTLLSQ